MMSARSFQLGIALAPSLPHFVHRIRGAEGRHRHIVRPTIDVDLGVVPAGAAGESSPRTPFRRMLPSVIGWIGSSSLPYFQAKNRQGTKSSAPAQFGSRNETNSLSGYDLGASSEGACDAIVTAVPDGCPLAPLQQPSSAAVTIGTLRGSTSA